MKAEPQNIEQANFEGRKKTFTVRAEVSFSNDPTQVVVPLT